MQISTNAYFRSQTENIQDLKTQTVKLQEQIATGKQLNIASDDPVAFSDLAMLKARDARLQQYGRNIDVARQKLTLEETALSQSSALELLLIMMMVARCNTAYLPNADDACLVHRAAQLPTVSYEMVEQRNRVVGCLRDIRKLHNWPHARRAD
jgi:flagellar hook-associated protein 3 FlgL